MVDCQIILVAGMHRSGTSALARMLNLLGARLGPELAPAAPGNARGYWEERPVVNLNDECLDHFGLTWDDPSPLPDGWLDAPWIQDWRERVAAHLRNAYNSSPLIAIKDPRLCRLLPVWRQILADLEIEPHVILAVRHPDEVALSLAKRDGMSKAHAKQLWLTYMLEAEFASRGQSRIFTSFAELLTDWETLAQRLGAEFGIEWPVETATAQAEIESFLNAGMRHTDPRPSSEPGTGQANLLAASVYAYASASSAGGMVPDVCWDTASSTLQSLRQDLPQLLSCHSTEIYTKNLAERPPLGVWEPAPLISEVIQARLYYRKATESASEHQHLAAVLPTATKPMRAEFTLPAGAKVDLIRFDPTMRRGIYRVLAVSVNGQPLKPADINWTAVHERRLPDESDALICFFSDDDDPHIELDMRVLSLRKDQPIQISITFECDSLFDRLERNFEQRGHALRTGLANLQHDLDALAASQAGIEATQQQLQMSLADLSEASESAHRRKQAEAQCTLVSAGWAPAVGARDELRTTAVLATKARLNPVPSRHLQLLAQHPESNVLWWRSIARQSFFQLELPGHAKLRAGWYLLSMNFTSIDGHALQPKIDINYADGNDESERIDLPVSSGARQRLLLRLKHTVDGLQLYPGTGDDFEFLLSLPRIRQISRAETHLRLALPRARYMRSRGHGWGQVCLQIWRTLMRGDLVAAAKELYSGKNDETQ